MTLAICLECGCKKQGALTLCAECGFTPSTEAEQAKSMLLSDHNMTADQLAANGAMIKAGEGLRFDEDSVGEMAALIRDNPDLLKMPVGCRIFVWAPFAILFILLVVIAVIYFAK